jgi:hypothetical protein
MEKIVVQKIVKDSPDVAKLYFGIIANINDLPLTDRDISLLSFVAMYGNISEKTNREAFCLLYKTTTDSINNIVSKLKKMGMLVKKDDVIKLPPIFGFDFKKNIQLQIELKHE